MNECLLCGNLLQATMKFSDLLLLRKSQTRVCPPCRMTFEKISNQHCPTCYKDGEAKVCQDCLSWQEKGKSVQHKAYFSYNDAMKSYFSQYKFQGDYLLHRVFAKDLQRELKNWPTYTLVPIPVSPQKFAKRGFNQVTAFLEGAGLKYQELLEKEDSQAQSSKSRKERLLSQQTFRLKQNIQLPDKILLVDDIYTTGATLQLAKEILVEAGVKEILTFSLAR